MRKRRTEGEQKELHEISENRKSHKPRTTRSERSCCENGERHHTRVPDSQWSGDRNLRAHAKKKWEGSWLDLPGFCQRMSGARIASGWSEVAIAVDAAQCSETRYSLSSYCQIFAETPPGISRSGLTLLLEVGPLQERSQRHRATN